MSTMVNDRIHMTRKRKGFTMTELAEKIGVSKQTLYKYEKGIVTNIPLDNIEKIAEVLGVTPAYIMGWEDYYVEDDGTFVACGFSREYTNEMKTRTKDAERLLVKKIVTPTATLSPDAEKLLADYHKLNTSGKEKANEYVSDLTTISKYTENEE